MIGGGYDNNEDSMEYLPTGSHTWQDLGEIVPHKAGYSCSVAISDTKILLLGGYNSNNGDKFSNIEYFDTTTRKWSGKLADLGDKKYKHACGLVGDKVQAIVKYR